VRLDYPEPPHSARYAEIVPSAAILFGQPLAQIAVDAAIMGQKLSSSDPVAARVAERTLHRSSQLVHAAEQVLHLSGKLPGNRKSGIVANRRQRCDGLLDEAQGIVGGHRVRPLLHQRELNARPPGDRQIVGRRSRGGHPPLWKMPTGSRLSSISTGESGTPEGGTMRSVLLPKGFQPLLGKIRPSSR